MTHSKTNSDALNELIERNGLPVSVILLPQVYPGGDVDNSIRVNNFDINMANKRVVLARKKKALREKDKEKKEEQIVPEQLPGFFGDLTIDDIYTRIERTQSVAKQKSNDQNKKKVNQLKSKVSGCNTNAIKETKKDKPKIDNSFTSNNSTDFGDMSSECKEIARMSSGSTAILEEITKNECTVTIDDEYATAGSIQSCPQIPLPASEARDEEQQNDFCTQKGNRNRMKKNKNRGYRIISQTNFTNTRRPFVIIKSATAKEKTSHEPKEKKTDKTEPKHLDSTMANHNIRAVPQGGKTKRQNRRKDDTGEQVEKFGEFRLFQGQQMPVPRLLKLNKKGTSREPSGNPIFDCANGYSNQSSMQAEFAQPIDLSEMNEDFDFETNLALFKKIKISPSSSHIEKNGTSECSVKARKKNFANDENILSDSSKVISWTQTPRLNRNVNGSGRVSKERDKKTVSKNNYIPTNKGLNKNTANTGRKKQRQMAFDSDASNDKEQNHSSSNVHTYPSSEGYQPLCMYPPHPLLNQAMLSAMYQQQHFLHAQCVGGYQGVPISTIQQQQIQQGPSRQKTVLVINDPKTNQPVRMTGDNVNEDLDDNAREHSHQQNNSDINIHNCGIQQGQQPFHYMPPVFPLPPEFSPQFLYAPALPLHPPVFNMMYYQHIYENLKFSVNSPDVNAYNIHHSQYLHGSQIPAEQSTVPSNNSNTYQTMESQREKSAIMLNSTQKANRKSTMEH